MSAAIPSPSGKPPTQPSPVEGMLIGRYREELSGRVLELGAAPGRLAVYLRALRAEVTLRAPDALEDLPAEEFDAAVATGGVLDQLPLGERRAAMAELGRVLLPGAVLIKSCPDHAARRHQAVASSRLSRDAQDRRLTEMGFELVESVEVSAGAELLLVARRDR